MDELIQGALQKGQFESQGRFSLDARLAPDFCLAEPEQFILLLVSWASRTGASRCEIRLSNSQLIFEQNGSTLSLAQLTQCIGTHSIGPSYGLALAVVGALQLKPRSLKIEVPEGTWTPSSVQAKPTASNFRFQLQLPYFQRFQQLSALLQGGCLHSSLAIEVNHKPLNRPLDLSKNLGSLALISSQAALPDFCPAPHHTQANWAEPYSLILGTDRGSFETQIHGVGSQHPAHVGLAIGPHLAVDASLLQPIQEPAMASQIQERWLELALQSIDQPTSDEDRLAALLDDLVQPLEGQPERLRTVLSGRLQLAQRRSQDPLPWLFRLAQLESACGRPQQALTYWRQAYQLRRQLQSAEGILVCLSQQPPSPASYREPLQTLLQANPKSCRLSLLCDWLWQGEQWEDAFRCHREWLPTLSDRQQRAQCLQRLVTLSQRLGRRLDEENYRIQAF